MLHVTITRTMFLRDLQLICNARNAANAFGSNFSYTNNKQYRQWEVKARRNFEMI